MAKKLNTNYKGKPEEYWTHVEKEREELFDKVAKMEVQIHEYSSQLEAELKKSESLSKQYESLINDLAGQLNVSPKPEEVIKAIQQDISVFDSVNKLAKENSVIKEEFVRATSSTTMAKQEIEELKEKLGTTQEILTQTTTKLDDVTEQLRQLLVTTGGNPLLNLKLIFFRLKIYRK